MRRSTQGLLNATPSPDPVPMPIHSPGSGLLVEITEPGEGV